VVTIATVGHKHTKAEILEGALAAALDDGLSQLTFGRLATRLGVSDRIIVYYFPNKAALVREVVVAMGQQLQATLAPAFTTPARGHRELIARAWPVLAQPENDRIFALFFEANGLAAVGREPYTGLVAELVEAWIVWAAALIDDAPERRRAQAETAIAVIDGLYLLRLLGGADAAERAATELGAR
jgi:AcrR family transcriptional regulator